MRIELRLRIEPGQHRNRFVATIEDSAEPTVDLELERDEGVLTCTAVTIRKQRGVTSRDIRIPLERYIETMYQHPVFVGKAAPPGQRRRRVITDDFLREVADLYVTSGRSVDAVRADHRFAASQSQVFRWLKTARERGLLDEEG